jgi:hypothetical protein
MDRRNVVEYCWNIDDKHIPLKSVVYDNICLPVYKNWPVGEYKYDIKKAS